MQNQRMNTPDQFDSFRNFIDNGIDPCNYPPYAYCPVVKKCPFRDFEDCIGEDCAMFTGWDKCGMVSSPGTKRSSTTSSSKSKNRNKSINGNRSK